MGGGSAITRTFEGASRVIELLEKVSEKDVSRQNEEPENIIQSPVVGKESKIYSKYTKGTILHTTTGNIRVDSDSTGTCCQDDKEATDTIPNLKRK